MNKLEVFIICHDQDIILENESSKKFKNIPIYRYLFVGNGNCEKIEDLKNVIICKKLKDNIENEKNLVAFTAWYALVKNDLISSEYVSLLEYDIDISDNFYEKHMELINMFNNFIIGYRAYPLNHIIYLNATPLLSESLQKIYNIDIAKFVSLYVQSFGFDMWTSSSNRTFGKDFIYKFVDWFIPIANYIKSDPMGAHVCERLIKIFCILNGYTEFFIRDVIKHWQSKSHKIEAFK